MNLESLIHARLDGEITPEQHAELESLLRGDWQARRLYLELADQHARLLQQPEVITGLLASPPAADAARRRWRQGLSLALVAVAVIALVLVLWDGGSGAEEPTSSGVAILSQTYDAEFSRGGLRSGDTLAPGGIRLLKGLAQVEFFSGATVLMEGDAEVQVISAWEARCLRGRVRVQVPPAARGFLMHAPGMKLEDLGTEFGLNVQDGESAVQVVEGEVIAHTKETPVSLKQGMRLGRTDAPFLAVGELQTLMKQQEARRHEAWQGWFKLARRDPRLIALYDFSHREAGGWDRSVPNLAEHGAARSDGGAVGARWTQGRWPGKGALEFKRPGDRVRLHLDGACSALTLACWVKVDSVDKKYNSLLLTDGYDDGEPHWQIFEDGSLMFSIAYRPAGAAKPGKFNQMYFSKPVFAADSLGRWHHLAVSYDAASGEVVQYFDGAEAGREVSPLHQPGRPVSFGPCEVGNWGLPTQGHPFPIRNLNGAIDEFCIYNAVLPPREIRAVYQAGRPE
jgi:ferric-dicitrate binding protein FerR (iron transport regulator)